AQELLAAARADLQAGRIDEARAKANQAATFDVTYDLFEDSPERLLAEVELAAKRGAPVAMSAPSALDLTAPVQEQAPTTGTRDRMVVNTAGLSAQELYEQGVNYLRQGNREAAYDSFLQAYHSGE